MSFSTNSSVPPPTRRALIAGAVCSTILSSCANPALFTRNIQAATAPLIGGAHTGFTRDQVSQFAAASMSVSVGGEIPQLLLLSQVNGADHQWGFQGQTILQTRGGRVTATGGLPHNLEHTSEISGDPAQTGLVQAEGESCLRILDFPDSYGAGCEAKSRFHIDRHETLEILGAHILTLRIVERVLVKSLSWRHSNVFWVEPATARVWRSRQHIHPELSAVTLTTLRPSNV